MNMSRKIGQAVFILSIWVYSLFYYLEVSAFDNFSEKMTIEAIFWLLSLFAALEMISVTRRFFSERQPSAMGSMASLAGLIKDPRFHLVIGIAAYLFLMPRLGFYTTSALSFVTFSVIMGTRRPIRILISCSVVLAFIYLIFSYALRLSLPAGCLI
jgi:hypothetical protein